MVQFNRTTHVAVGSIPETGFLRIDQVLQFIPISKSSWWSGIATGRYPAPIKLGPRTTAWKVEDLRALIERLSGGEG